MGLNSEYLVDKFPCKLCWYYKTGTFSDIDGLAQDCSISIANAMEILQSFTKPSISSKKIIKTYVIVFYIPSTVTKSTSRLQWL